MIDRSPVGLLLDRDRLRRLRRAVTRRVDEFALEVTEDPERASLVADPFVSMADVRDRLGALEAALLEASDRRAVFLTIYTEMTAATIRAIDDGTFQDPDWMERYLVRFAEYYRRAFRDYERGEMAAVPDPWIVAFGAAVRGDGLVLQDALLGINAHINYDLALTLSDGGLDPDRPSKYADHTRVNEILRRLVSVQQELLAERYAQGIGRAGDRLGEFDDMIAALGLRQAREQAWQVAVVRTDARWLPVDRYSRWLLSRTATGGAYLVLRPAANPATMRLLRDLERDELELATQAQEFHARARTVI